MTNGVEKGSKVARKLMEEMGWKEGQGLGKEKQGILVAIKPKKKVDNQGIGSVQTHTKWIAASCTYDNILAKLNIAYNNNDQESEAEEEDDKTKAKKQRKEEREAKRRRKEEKRARKEKKKEKKEKERSLLQEMETQGAKVRQAVFAKRQRSKQVSLYSELDKSEIFGGRSTAKVPIVSAIASSAEDSDDEGMVPLSPAAVLGIANSQEAQKQPTGFTEDTQVNIYNNAMENQIKGRKGLGLHANMSKSRRKEAAITDAKMLREGSYLARKFEYGGRLADFDLAPKKVVEKVVEHVASEEVAVEKTEKRDKKEKKEKKEKLSKAERKEKKLKKRERKSKRSREEDED